MMKISLLVLFVLTSTFGEESRVVCPEFEVAYGGSDGQYQQIIKYISSWEDCGQACSATYNCNFWSWDMYLAGDYCYLYGTNTGLHYDPNFISGKRGCPEDEGC